MMIIIVTIIIILLVYLKFYEHFKLDVEVVRGITEKFLGFRHTSPRPPLRNNINHIHLGSVTTVYQLPSFLNPLRTGRAPTVNWQPQHQGQLNHYFVNAFLPWKPKILNLPKAQLERMKADL